MEFNPQEISTKQCFVGLGAGVVHQKRECLVTSAPAVLVGRQVGSMKESDRQVNIVRGTVAYVTIQSKLEQALLGIKSAILTALEAGNAATTQLACKSTMQ